MNALEQVAKNAVTVWRIKKLNDCEHPNLVDHICAEFRPKFHKLWPQEFEKAPVLRAPFGNFSSQINMGVDWANAGSGLCFEAHTAKTIKLTASADEYD